MLNRRHLRIKVLQFLYAYYQSEEDDFGSIQKQMMTSVDRIYDLYLYLLLTFSEVKTIAEERIETQVEIISLLLKNKVSFKTLQTQTKKNFYQ